MMKTIFLAAVVLVLACGGRAAQQQDVLLAWRLQAPELARSGEPVELRFTLTNHGAEPLWVLAWYTPLEGMWGDIFVVHLDGERLAYQGPMVKRAAPAREDYVLLRAGESVTEEIDLALGYPLDGSGRLTVAFRGRLLDVAREGEPVPPADGAERPLEIPGDPIALDLM